MVHMRTCARPVVTGGKKKPLKAPKKERKDVDEVRTSDSNIVLLESSNH